MPISAPGTSGKSGGNMQGTNPQSKDGSTPAALDVPWNLASRAPTVRYWRGSRNRFDPSAVGWANPKRIRRDKAVLANQIDQEGWVERGCVYVEPKRDPLSEAAESNRLTRISGSDIDQDRHAVLRLVLHPPQGRFRYQPIGEDPHPESTPERQFRQSRELRVQCGLAAEQTCVSDSRAFEEVERPPEGSEAHVPGAGASFGASKAVLAIAVACGSDGDVSHCTSRVPETPPFGVPPPSPVAEPVPPLYRARQPHTT